MGPETRTWPRGPKDGPENEPGMIQGTPETGSRGIWGTNPKGIPEPGNQGTPKRGQNIPREARSSEGGIR